MKKNFSIRFLLVAGLLFVTSFGFAQVTVSGLAQLKAALAAGETDIITDDFIDVDEDFKLVSTVPVKITVGDRMFAMDGGTFTIGANIKIVTTVSNAITAESGGKVFIESGCTITSEATAPLSAAGGTITVNGGTIATSNFPAASAGTADGPGTLIINGGVLSTSSDNAAAFPRGIVVDYSGICIVTGGEIHSDVGGGRGISVNTTNSGGKLYVTGGTITATASDGRAIQVDNNNGRLWLSGSPIVRGGADAIIVQKDGIAVIHGTPSLTGRMGINVQTAGTNYPRLYDCRNLTAITATPAPGAYTGNQQVTLSGGTGTANKYSGTAAGMVTTPSGTVTVSSLVYTTDGVNPTIESTPYAAPFTVLIPSAVTVASMIDGVVGAPFVFAYTDPSSIPALQIAQNISYFGNVISFEQPVKSALLFDCTGKLVLSVKNANSVDVSVLLPGVYVLKYAEGIFKFVK